jgi:hypothetical protein
MVAVAVAVCGAAALASCGRAAGPPSMPTAHATAVPPPRPGCALASVNGLRAISLSFDRRCLAVPSGRATVLEFANDDAAESHDVAIYRRDSCMARAAVKGLLPSCDHPFASALFRGSVIVGVARITYRIPALSAGRYVFVCEVHAWMHGAFRVG